MGVLTGRTRRQLQAEFNAISATLPLPFALAEAFAAMTDGFVEPDASDMQILGRLLHRIGFEKFRVRDGAQRKVVWALKVAEMDIGTKIDTPAERPLPKWAVDLVEWAEEQTAPFRMEEALREATPFYDAPTITMSDLREGARVLRAYGYNNGRVMLQGEQAMRWQKMTDI